MQNKDSEKKRLNSKRRKIAVDGDEWKVAKC